MTPGGKYRVHNHHQEVLGPLTLHHLHLGASSRHRQASELLRRLPVGGREEQGSPTPGLGRRLPDPTQRPGLDSLDRNCHKKGNELQQPPYKGKKTCQRRHDQNAHRKNQAGEGLASRRLNQQRSQGHPVRLPSEAGRDLREPSITQPTPVLGELVQVW